MARRPEKRPDRAVYVISVVAEMTGTHPQTLREYERRGLVEPKRTLGGSRRYSDSDVAEIERILELTSDGLNLSGVQMVLDLERQNQKLRDEVQRLRRALDHAQRLLKEAERKLIERRRGVLVRLSDVRNVLDRMQ